MAAALIIYTVLTLALSSWIVQRPGYLSESQFFHSRFNISLLAAAVLALFAVLAHPVLFEVEPVFAGLFSGPFGELAVELALILTAAVLISAVVHHCRVPYLGLWLHAVLIASFLYYRISKVLELDAPIVPDWRFAAVSIVLYTSFLLLTEIILWLMNRKTADRDDLALLESTRLFSILPAILIYSFGLARNV